MYLGVPVLQCKGTGGSSARTQGVDDADDAIGTRVGNAGRTGDGVGNDARTDLRTPRAAWV